MPSDDHNSVWIRFDLEDQPISTSLSKINSIAAVNLRKKLSGLIIFLMHYMYSINGTLNSQSLDFRENKSE